MIEHVADSREERQRQAARAPDQQERLRVILNQALDEWLRAYVVNLMTNIVRQPGDEAAVDRALVGAKKAIDGWYKAIDAIDKMEV